MMEGREGGRTNGCARIASRRRSFYVAHACWTTTCLLALVSKFVFFSFILVLHVVLYGKTTTDGRRLRDAAR